MRFLARNSSWREKWTECIEVIAPIERRLPATQLAKVLVRLVPT